MAAANDDEREVLPELTEEIRRLLIADKGLVRPELRALLIQKGIDLQTPLRANIQDNRSKMVC